MPTLLQEFDARAKAVQLSWGYDEMRELLRFARLNKIPRPAVVLALGKKILKDYSGRLSDEVWNIHEQVFEAGLECDDLPAAKASLAKLQQQFPAKSSVRVGLLVGRLQEYEGDLKGAAATYSMLLDSNEANTVALKRQIALAVTMGETDSAVELLNDYCKLFGSDPSAWHELGQLYAEAGQYTEAAFCFEELVMLEPLNDVWHTLLGECLLSVGGYSNELQARKHMSQAVKLSRSKSARALYGLAMATVAVNSYSKSSRADATACSTLHAVAAEGLKALFRDVKATPTVAAATSVLDAQAATFDA